MKKLIFILLIACVSITQAQKFKGLDNSPLDKSTYPVANKITEKAAIVYYSRPQLKGRAYRGHPYAWEGLENGCK